jgi:Zn-dependent protease with chaperone function
MAAAGRGVRATALRKYALLESTGIYHDGLASRPQEVVVRFGEATLTLQDFEDTPLAHWALAGLRRLESSDPSELRLAPDMEGDERLVLRDPAMIEAIEAVCPDLDRSPPRRRGAGRLLAWGAAALAALSLILLVVLPDLSARIVSMVPPEQERRLGEAVKAQALRMLSAEPCAAPGGRRALERMSGRLVAAMEDPGAVDVAVVRHEAVDAFAAPGGQVVLTSGLIEAARSPEEVAAVLAHELGHVVHRDPLQQAVRAAGSAGVLGLLFGDVVGGAAAAAMAEAALNAAYSREAERRADAYAHELLERAGLPAGALGDFFETLRAREAPPRGLVQHFASHPDLGARIAAARAADTVSGAPFRPALDDAGWIALQQICE